MAFKKKIGMAAGVILPAAAVLAYEARGDAIADGRLRTRPKKIMGL